ncbi:hypothetical protein PVPAM_110069100 [Plasmodium vivax]|nr:hypothetical protein PVPAM_110069100 [Plasmodium vivax]
MGSLEQAENNCSLSKFIKILDNANGKERIDFDDEIKIIDSTQRDNVLTFFSNLKEIYSYITTYNVNIRNKCCSYLNFWIDQKKEENVESDISDEAWGVIENLWYRLKGNHNFSCKRERHNVAMDHKKTCIDFMVYCVNRDELKQKCQQNDDDDDGLKQMYCNNFNEFTDKYYDHFTTKVTCLRDTNKYIHYNWRFSDSCTLHNMAKTFPKYDTSKNNIVDDEKRQQIQKCKIPEPSETMDCYMFDGVPVTLEELSTTINVIPLKYGIYAGSTFLGFFSLGLYLYKKTRHASLNRSNTSRKKNINKNTDKQFSHEHEKKSYSKNKDYKFSYNPT